MKKSTKFYILFIVANIFVSAVIAFLMTYAGLCILSAFQITACFPVMVVCGISVLCGVIFSNLMTGRLKDKYCEAVAREIFHGSVHY